VKDLDEWINKLSEVRSEVRKGEREFDRLQVEVEDYKESDRANLRRKATGTEFAILTTSREREYHKVRINLLTKTEMSIVQRDGPSTIPVTELPRDLVKRYQLDLGEAVLLIQEREDQEAAQRRKFLAKRAALAKAEKERMEKEEARAGRLGPKGGRRGEVDDESSAKIDVLDAKLKLMYRDFGALQRKLASAQAQIGGTERSPQGVCKPGRNAPIS
jgi:hypothetical protein